MKNLYPEHRCTLDAIHAAATLNHLATATPAYARVLDMGCEEATRLVVSAKAYPESVTVAIDRNADNILWGQQLATRHGLSNIELFAASVDDLLAVDPGEFDYIIIRQSFAPRSEEQRDLLLKWCRTHLAENGVVCLFWSRSVDTQPEQILGDALRFHCQRTGEDSVSQVSAARGMLSYLIMTLPDGELKDQALTAERMDDVALMDNYLCKDIVASNFYAACDAFEKSGLGYIGDVVPQYELIACQNAATQRLHALMSTGASRTLAQQYLDLATDHQHRFVMVSHMANLKPISSPDTDMLELFHWAGHFEARKNEKGQITTVYLNGRGIPIHVNSVITRQILDVLGGAWPMSLSFEQIVFNCRQVEGESDVRRQVLESLYFLFIHNVDGLYWSASAGPYNGAANYTLQSIIPDGLQHPGDGGVDLVNFWGGAVTLTSGEWAYLQEGMQATSDQAETYFLSLWRKGLLTGSPTAWKKHIQLFMRAGSLSLLKIKYRAMILLSVGVRRGGLQQQEFDDSVTQNSEIDTDAIYTAINGLIRDGKIVQARQYASEFLQQHPEDLHALRCYSRICVLTGAWDDALDSACQLLGYYFSSREVWFDLVTGFQKKHQHYYARAILQSLLRLDDKNQDLWYALASSHYAFGHMNLAEKCCREALRFQKMNARHFSMMGIILSDNQKIEESGYFFKKALELEPENLDYLTSQLFVMLHDDSVPFNELRDKHMEFGRIVGQWAARQELTLPLTSRKDKARKLRVGFVSGDLRDHPVANFLLPFWDGMNREHFELVGYNSSPLEDVMTEHLKSGAVLWRKVAEMRDVDLAKQIHDDRIDILIDLAGHTTYNRLPVFALRPAPIQMSWIGYPGTSGMTTMDYRILSTYCQEPPGLEEQFVEKIIYIPMGKLFEPREDSPDVSPLPALTNGYITFGSFNRPKKINERVLSLWARIMVAYPQAKLIIGCMNDDFITQRVKTQLVSRGVQEEQLIFKGKMDITEYLSSHSYIDILLDTFPYTGGTTTNHAAWMGVPTLTLCGQTLAGRQGVENMNSYGLSQFIAMSQDEYVEKALSWQDNVEELNAIRLSMRSRIPGNDGATFNAAEYFEKALRQAWERYCDGMDAQSFVING